MTTARHNEECKETFISLRAELFVSAFVIIFLLCCGRVVVFHFSTQPLDPGPLETDVLATQHYRVVLSKPSYINKPYVNLH